MKTPVIAVIGLGYVGLPLAIEFGKQFSTIGFDISTRKIDELSRGIDSNGEVSAPEFKQSKTRFTHNPNDLARATVFIITVPTPIDSAKMPDLSPLISASTLVGSHMKKGSLIIYESTVYPGATEEVCVPVLEKASGLKWGTDFKVGYSPERMNPGDKHRTVTKITKVVAGEDADTLKVVADLYGRIITAGIHKASSIKVAEAAKVIENTQRDLNIALMNELAIIFNRLKINTRDVLEAAGTKWNFIKMTPGLVGGHCIGVDPYYLTYKAEQAGYHPQVILAGRRINDGMGKYIAEQTIKQLSQAGASIKNANILILGFTFKENVSDCRNTRVIDIYHELKEYGANVFVHDPNVNSDHVAHEYGIALHALSDVPKVEAIILATPHDVFKGLTSKKLAAFYSKSAASKVFIDIKYALSNQIDSTFRYWSL